MCTTTMKVIMCSVLLLLVPKQSYYSCIQSGCVPNYVLKPQAVLRLANSQDCMLCNIKGNIALWRKHSVDSTHLINLYPNNSKQKNKFCCLNLDAPTNAVQGQQYQQLHKLQDMKSFVLE